MDTQSDFERDIAARVDRVESAVFALSEKVDAIAAGRAKVGPGRPFASASPGAGQPERPKVAPKLHRLAEQPSEVRGADWWLARAGAGLTVIAIILLYQYAVGHGWITPWVRVLTGAAVGAGLMYWGRKMPPSDPADTLPVALRELMMGAALAIWYISAFATSSLYHLVPMSASRYVFLLLSVVGGTLSLKERRSGLALLAVTAGFLGPVMLSDGVPSVPSYAFYIAVLGGMSIVLYLMRGWQSILWISFFAMSLTLALPVFAAEPWITAVVSVAAAIAYTRAPSLRRGLVATGAERYTEPVRSRFATHWLNETGRFFKLFSPAAGSPDSASLWILTIAAPFVGVSSLASLWPSAYGAVFALAALAVAAGAYRFCATNDDTNEVTHVAGAMALVWATFGAIEFANWLIPPRVIDHGTGALMIFSVAAMLPLLLLDQARFVAARGAARVMACLAVLVVLFNEAGFMNRPLLNGEDPIKVALSSAELIAIAASVVAWRDMRRREIGSDAANVVVLMSYGALLLIDSRVVGAIWTPLVTATFAIAGTAMLIMNRNENDKLLRAVAVGTLLIVMLRLFFIDMVGVDTIWRIILFLGVGALFLFTSRRLQVDKQTPSEST